MEISVPEFTRDNDRGQVGIETLIVFIAMILVAAIAASVLINTAGFLQNQASETSQDSEDQVSNQVLIISSIGEVATVGEGEEEVTFEYDETEEEIEHTNDEFVFSEDDGDLIVEDDEGGEYDWTANDGEVDDTTVLDIEEIEELEADSTYTITWSVDDSEWELDDENTEDPETVLINPENQIGEISMTVMQSPGADEIDLGGASIEYIGPDGQETLTFEDGFEVDGTQDEDGTAPVLTQRQDRFTIEIALEDDDESDLRFLEEGEDATVRITTQSGSEAVTIVNTPQSLSSYDDGDAVEL